MNTPVFTVRIVSNGFIVEPAYGARMEGQCAKSSDIHVFTTDVQVASFFRRAKKDTDKNA